MAATSQLPPTPRDFSDRAFKDLLSDLGNLRDLTEVAAPEYADYLDCLNAEIVPPEVIVSEVPDWPKVISDTIYEIPILGGALGDSKFPLCVKVVEHQSKPEEDSIFRAFWAIAATWKHQLQDWERGQRQGPFRLTPGTGIIIYTGAQPWNGPRNLWSLIHESTPQPLVGASPGWTPRIWEVRQRSIEQLLDMDQRLFQSLAVVRGQYESPNDFEDIFAQILKRLDSLRQEDPGRWIGLARFVFSWGLAKRRREEHDHLRATMRKVYRGMQAQDQIAEVEETIAEFLFRQGAEQGLEQGEVLGRRESLISLLSAKFAPNVDEAVTRRIGAAVDPNTLKHWFEAALSAESWPQFLKTVNWA